MAQTQLYLKKAQLCIKEESSQDTFEVPAGDGTDIFLAENVTVAYEGNNYRPNYAHGDFLNMDEVPGPMTCTISFRIPIKGSGTVDSAPEYNEFLKACGLEETIVASTSVTYTPLSTFDGAGGNPGPSYSCSLLENGVRYACYGAFGTGRLVCSVGEGAPGYIEGEMRGAYQAVADDALESPTYETTAAPSFLGASFSENFGGAHTPKGVRAFTLDMGNEITLGEDANEAAGYYGSRIVAMNPSGEYEIEMQLVATKDYFGAQRAGTSGTITTGVIGSSAGNQWAITVNRAIKRPIQLTERGGIRGITVPFAVSSAATDVEGTNHPWQLQFT